MVLAEKKPMLDIRQTAAPETETTVTCRPTGSLRAALWLVIVIQTLFALGFLLAQCLSGMMMRPSPTGAILGVSFALLGVQAAVYLAKTCVVANVEGLQWRGAGRWRAAKWKDVVSYSDEWLSNTTSQKKPLMKIRTLSGTVIVSPASWTSAAELRESVSRYATGASQSGWLVTGGGATYLPLSCRYDTTINRNILGWMEKVHKYGLLAVAVYFALQWFTTHTLPGWGWLLTPTGLFVIAKQTLPFALRPTYRATQPRLGDKVYADKDSLRFVSGGIQATIAWDEITDLYTAGIRSVVVTQGGREYDFLATLTDVERLKLIIPRLATNAGYKGWRTGTVRRQEIAAKDGQQAVECVYRYRSLENGGKLWGLTLAALFLTGIAAGPALVAWQGGMAPGSREVGLALGAVLGLLALVWLWGNYFRAGIRTNEEGITQQSLFGRRFIAWSQVRAFCWRGGADLTWGCVEGVSGTITFWKGIGDADRLVDEIAAHGVTVR